MASKKDTAAFLKLARDRFKQAEEADKNQRQRELDDLRFYAGDQWPEDIKTARAGMAAGAGLPAVPARPCLTINKTREPVRQVLNQERQSDMGIEIVPADDFGELIGDIDDTEIQVREGLVRRIQRDSKAADARTWAFARAVQAGRGYYGVMTRYVPGKTNDQEIFIRRFYNQASVTLDPAHEQPDGSDAEWGFIGTQMPWSIYKVEHPKRAGKVNRIADCEDAEFRALGDEQPDWFKAEGDLRSVRVVEYFYTERETRELVTYRLADGREVTEWADEMPEPPPGGVEVEGSRRDVIEKTIKWAKLDGCDDGPLDETDWPGPDLPIVKVLGEELQPYDAERRVEGMVRPMRDPGQGFNAMASKVVEVVAYAPIPPIMMAEGQDEGFTQEYEVANTRALPVLHYKQTDLEDRLAPPPFSTPREAPIAAAAGALQMFDEAIQSASGQHDPSLGKVDPSIKSGRAIKALQEQSARSSNHFIDNLQRSIRYEGQIINNLLYPIYGRPGRIARIVNAENEPETIMLHQPFVQGQQGRPQAAKGDETDAKTYTLTKDAKFNVIVKVSKSFDSRREQEATIVGDLLSAAPQLMTWFGDLFFKNQDGPGHTEMADRAKVMLDPKILQMIESKAKGQEIPPQVQAQLAQKDQQLQELSQVAQQMQQQIQTDAVKEQAETQRKQQALAADLERAKIEASLKLEIAKMDNATKLQIEEYKLRGAQMQAELDAREQQLGAQQQREQQDHERGMAGATAQHDADQAAQGREHESAEAREAREAQSGEAAAGRAHEAQMADQARQAAAEQAAMQPPQGGA